MRRWRLRRTLRDLSKDATLHPDRLKDYLAEERVQRFLALKRELDPESLLQTDLFRRIFGPTWEG